MKKLNLFLFSCLLLLMACNKKSGEQVQSDNQQHIALYMNELYNKFYQIDSCFLIAKGNSYELCDEFSFLDIDSINPSMLHLKEDCNGTSYIGDCDEYFILLDHSLPTILYLQQSVGSYRASANEIREDAEIAVEEELDAKGKSREDISEEEFERLIEEYLNNGEEEVTEADENPYASYEQEEASFQLAIYQKRDNNWVSVQKEYLPSDFFSQLRRHLPFADVHTLSSEGDTSDYYIDIHYYDINPRQNWQMVQDVYGFKDSLNENNNMPAAYFEIIGNQGFNFKIADNYQFSFVWQNDKMAMKAPAKVPFFEEESNCFGVSVEQPNRTVKLRGKIDNETDFSMALELQRRMNQECDFSIDINFNSRYWYDTPQKTMMRLGGDICGKNDVTILRYNDSFESAEIFKGRFVSDCRIEGTWEHLEKKLKKPFFVELVK